MITLFRGRVKMLSNITAVATPYRALQILFISLYAKTILLYNNKK